MKLAVVTLFLLALAHVSALCETGLEALGYNYLTRVALPLAEKIRKSEAEGGSRVLDGLSAGLGQFPYHAGVISQFALGEGVCSGVLISPQVVLTAASCWCDGVYVATSVTVALGTVTVFSGGTRLSTNDVMVHSQWNPCLFNNNIALIKFTSNVPLSTNIAVIALPSGTQLDEDFAGENAFISGYGDTGDGPTVSNLNYATVPVISNLACTVIFPLLIRESNICTSTISGGNTCESDYGGALAIERNGERILIGLAMSNFGSDCMYSFGDIHTRITSYTSFINQNM